MHVDYYSPVLVVIAMVVSFRFTLAFSKAEQLVVLRHQANWEGLLWAMPSRRSISYSQIMSQDPTMLTALQEAQQAHAAAKARRWG